MYKNLAPFESHFITILKWINFSHMIQSRQWEPIAKLQRFAPVFGRFSFGQYHYLVLQVEFIFFEISIQTCHSNIWQWFRIELILMISDFHGFNKANIWSFTWRATMARLRTSFVMVEIADVYGNISPIQ